MRYNEDDMAALAENEERSAEEARLRSISRRTRNKMVVAKQRGYGTDLQLERTTHEDLDEASA